tara:strand:- start:10804 stop:11949 length:1146 start_codon:yes stop_codon:yes gene_type:complete
MKIMQVIGGLGNGGAEKLVVELSNQLSLTDEVSLLSFRSVEKWMAFPKLLNKNIDLITTGKKPGVNLFWFLKLLKIIRYKKPDVINLHLDTALFLFLPLICILNGLFFYNIKFYYTIHNKLVISSKSDSNPTKYSNSKIFDFMNKIRSIPIEFICISKSILDDFESRYNRIKFSLIENGCVRMEKTNNFKIINEKINQYRINKNTVVFLAIGRISPQKNYEQALRIMRHYKERNVVLLIIGNETTKGRPLFNHLQSLKPSNVFFLETVDHVSDYIINTDAIFFTSHYEGMPITAIEAMSMGKPIICTPAGGLVDMVESGINGFIAKNFSDDSLIAEIDSFLQTSDKELMLIKQNNQRSFQERYSLERCASNYRKIYINSNA